MHTSKLRPLVLEENRIWPAVDLVQVEHLQFRVHQGAPDVCSIYRRTRVGIIVPFPILLIQLLKVAIWRLMLRRRGHGQVIRHRHLVGTIEQRCLVRKGALNLRWDWFNFLCEQLVNLQVQVAQIVTFLPRLPALWHDQLGNSNPVSSCFFHSCHKALPVGELCQSGMKSWWSRDDIAAFDHLT